MARRATILAAYFLFGAYAVCAQATLLREAEVLLFGSELSWGLVLAFWLAGVGIGAAGAGRLVENSARPWLTFAVAGLAMPVALGLEIALLRVARSFVGAGPGEYVGPGAMIWITLAATLPVSIWVGLSFPAASAMLARTGQAAHEKALAVGWAYLIEAGGSLLGGILFSFVFAERGPGIWMALGGGAALAVPIAVLVSRSTQSRGWPTAILVLFVVLPAALVAEGVAGRLDELTVHRRWETFAAGLRLADSSDTRYQNVAIGQLENQFSLYANGIVASTWPNHGDLAIQAHLAACETPKPKRILLLGGGAEGVLKELLRYKPERLDYVTLDEKMFGLLRRYLDQPDAQALDDSSVRLYFEDIRRFVKRAAARGDTYDLVYLAAPEPASALEARLYSEDFFGELARAMAGDGVLAFSLSGSVGYWSRQPAAYVGSIVAPLKRVYPEVLLTFGQPTRCFAAKRAGVLADTGQVLANRYRASGVRSPYFDPVWFAGASDLLDPQKRAGVTRALATHPPAFLNTDDRPAAALYHMWFWLQTSESSHARPDAPAAQRFDLLGALVGLRMQHVGAAVLAATVLTAVGGLVLGRGGLGRAAVLWSVGTTGFASMALEMVLLYTFQTIYGYVYSMVGLVVGVFMFGLMLGSLAMNRHLRRTSTDASRRPGLRTAMALDLAVAVFAAALVIVLALLRQSAVAWPIEVVTIALVAVSGILGGLVFPLAAAIRLGERTSTSRAAGTVAGADYVGACLGALVTGTFLVPILGVSGACLVTAMLKVLSGLLVGIAATAAASAKVR